MAYRMCTYCAQPRAAHEKSSSTVGVARWAHSLLLVPSMRRAKQGFGWQAAWAHADSHTPLAEVLR
jgi:hypothetical protein